MQLRNSSGCEWLGQSYRSFVEFFELPKDKGEAASLAYFEVAMQFEGDMQVLHWLSDEDRREMISWKAWTALRRLMEPPAGLPGISGGIHYFLVCVHDNNVPVNLIPHKYLVEPDGRIGVDNFAGLTRKERADYSRIMVASKYGPGDENRLNEIHRNMSKVYFPPKESVASLMRALPQAALAGSAAARFLHELSGG
jgi:hypothetical protein